MTMTKSRLFWLHLHFKRFRVKTVNFTEPYIHYFRAHLHILSTVIDFSLKFHMNFR